MGIDKIKITEGSPRGVHLRKAVAADEAKILSWQNVPGARQYCRNPEPIAAVQHHQWFTAKLADQHCRLCIITKDGRDVGMLRLDCLDESSRQYEISLLVDQTMKGQGVGKAAVDAAKRLIDQGTLLAEVLPENKASKRLFLAVGFIPCAGADQGTWLRYEVE